LTDARRGHLNEPAQMPDDWTETGVGPALGARGSRK